MSRFDNLISAGVYEKQINKLKLKYQQSGKLYSATDRGISFSDVFYNTKKCAKLLAKEIKKQTYQLSPVTHFTIKKSNGSDRSIYECSPFDYIIQSAFCDVIMHHFTSICSQNSYAYIKNRGSNLANKNVAAYIRSKQQQTTKHLDLYCMQFDIKQFAETVPVIAGAPIWAILDDTLKTKDGTPLFSDYQRYLFNNMVRPIITERYRWYQLFHGVTAGTPVFPVITNLYLHNLDEVMSHALVGGIYVRYSDDLLLIHDNLEIIYKAKELLETTLDQLGLEIHKDKTILSYLTQSGIPCQDQKFKGAQSISLLGYQLFADGTIGFNKRSLNNLHRSINQRIHQLKNTLDYGDDYVKKMCQAINLTINPTSPLACSVIKHQLRNVTSRRQLKQIDHDTALKLAATITRLEPKQALKKISYHRLRHHYGLMSLCQIKNKKRCHYA